MVYPGREQRATCEVCGAPAVSQVRDMRVVRDNPSSMYREFEPCGGVHSFCAAHDRESQCYDPGPNLRALLTDKPETIDTEEA